MAGSAAVESRAQAIVKPARWPIDAPDGSSARFSRVRISISPIESTSQTPGPGRVVADPRRIAGQGDDVPDAERVGAEQLRLEGHQVPVARRAVDQALEVEVVLDPERDRQRAHPDPGHRRVRDVDDVDARVAQEPRRLDRPLDPDAPRRVDLDRDDEPPGGKQLGEPGRRRRLLAGVRRAARSARDVAGDGRGTAIEGGAAARSSGIHGRGGVVEREAHRGDVLGGGAAAAAEDPGAGGEHPRRHRPEVLGAGREDEAALEPLRQAGVRHDQPRRIAVGRRAHRLQRVQAGRRAGPAVHPDHVRAGPPERRRGFRRPAAVDEDPLLAEGQRSDHRQVGRAPRLVDGDEQRREIGERLEDDRVDAALEQAVDLLPERRPSLRLGDGRPRRGPPARAVPRTRRRAHRGR